VWFFSLGERHHKPIFEWLQQQLEQQSSAQGQLQQQQQSEAGSEGAEADTSGPSYTVVATIKEVPQVCVEVVSVCVLPLHLGTALHSLSSHCHSHS
jgi:hypothetical protein